MVTSSQVAQMLQYSVAPCVLISGAGLLLLAMANRLPRPIDRARQLCVHVKNNPGPEGEVYRRQLRIFYKRSHLLRNAIFFNILSVVCIACVVFLLFVGDLFNWTLAFWVKAIFMIGLLSLISSLMFFLSDISLTLKTLQLEVDETGISL